MFHIFIVEDDEVIRKNLILLLKHALYDVSAAEEFTGVLDRIKKEKPDLILLDINLPGQDGMQILRDLREVSDIPVIFLTGNAGPADELNGMLSGADDYVTKPYQGAVLLARIAAVLKRAGGQRGKEQLTHCGVSFDPASGVLKKGGKKADLTKNEIKIIHCLFEQKGRIVPRADMIEYLWDNKVFIDDNTLSVNMTRIREKLRSIGADDFIETKRGLGYKI